MQSRLGECPFRPEHLPRLQLECRRTPILCNRGWEDAPFRPSACRVCSWNAAERRFYAIAAGKTPPAAGMLATFAAGMPQKADFMQSRQEKRTLLLECLPRLQLECRRRPISCNRGRRTPLPAGMFAAFATGVPQNADFMQSRLGKCPFRPECLPRLQLECRRTPILCNRGRENASFGPNACREHSF